MNKTSLRQKYLTLLNDIPNKKTKDLQIVKKLQNLNHKFINYLLYKPFKNEPDINFFIKFLEENNKKIFIATLDFETEEKIDIAVIPGLAFSEDKYRLGRGGGWYDKFLSIHPEIYKIGVCYKEQIVDRLAVEPHDITMDLIITD